MAKVEISKLKSWFSAGKYPTGAQFASLIDSFRHKDEKVAISDVENLSEELNNRYTVEEAKLVKDALKLKGDVWSQLLANAYFNGETYRWCKVTFFSDNGFYGSGFQEYESIEVDVWSMIEQFMSNGSARFTVTKWMGFDPTDVSKCKVARVDFVVSGAKEVSVLPQEPLNNMFGVKIYLKKQ